MLGFKEPITFILTKNADTILNEEFYNLLRLNFFKEKDNSFYRCPRIDYDLEIFIKRQWKPIPLIHKSTMHVVILY